ncbi:MAG: hypothetical protein LBS01_03715 [Prevotellaceae bacterium]|nr:hypothetical protein [Prevotellaceae bacterium]
MPLEILQFIIDNDCIPDLALNSIHGTEYGKLLLRKNTWFLTRFFQPDLFNSNLFETLSYDYE